MLIIFSFVKGFQNCPSIHFAIYIIKQDIRIYIYVAYIAGQTAGPIGLNFFVDTYGWPWGVIE